MGTPTKRETIQYPDSNWIRFEHGFGHHDSWGDTDLEATADLETFQIEMYKRTGKDNDGYGQSDDCEIALNVEEARELHLLLHMWLEAKAEDAGEADRP